MKNNQYKTPIAIIEKMINNGDLGEFIGKSYADKKTLGGVLNAASSLLPILGNIGTLLKGSQMGHEVQENVNPYGYQNGGPIKPKPVARESTAVNLPLENFSTLSQSPLITDPESRGLSARQAMYINSSIDRNNRAIKDSGYEGRLLVKDPQTGRTTFKYGGYKQYNAPSHEMGGQLIDDNGTPNPNGNSEIEGTENMYTYSNIPRKDKYIFSDKNGTSELVRGIINKKKKI